MWQCSHPISVITIENTDFADHWPFHSFPVVGVRPNPIANADVMALALLCCLPWALVEIDRKKCSQWVLSSNVYRQRKSAQLEEFLHMFANISHILSGLSRFESDLTTHTIAEHFHLNLEIQTFFTSEKYNFCMWKISFLISLDIKILIEGL